MNFSELPLHEQILAGIRKAGFEQCTDVQHRVLPVALTGKDVMVQSKTGSGKTAVYAITILQRFITAQAENKESKALVIAPTRELAVQIKADIDELAVGVKDFQIGCFYGGVGYAKQDEWIEQGLDVYVATPGRILDYQKMKKVDFRQFDIFVVDEADRLFDMGFYPDIQKMFSLLRPVKERQTMLFSATLSTKVRHLAWQFMNEPKEIEVQPEEITVKEITQELYHISKDEKFGLLLQLLKQDEPASCLIFTNTKARCVEVSKRLSMNGYQSKYLMGDLPQRKRLEIIGWMKSGKLRFLVATDVAARGLQIDDLALVVNYDIPEDYESYVHRIGRTARAGKSGKSITLADEEYVFNLEAIEEFIQMKIPVIWPEDLPEVEDKSASYTFRDLVPRTGVRSSSARRGGTPSPSRGRKQAPRRAPERKQRRPRPAAPPKQHPPRRSAKAYADLSALPLEERLAYYKKEYLGNQQPADEPVKKTSSPKPVDAKEEQAKKKGFFARLFANRGK